MRVAVTGAAGLLGHELVRVFSEHGHTVIAGVHDATMKWAGRVTNLPLDLADKTSIRRFVDEAQADCIIHSAAMTHVDRCETEPALAERLNATATINLVDAVSDTKARIVYISTDFVFDGVDGPYREEDPLNPINVYGRTKRAGEVAVRKAGRDQAIIRSASFLGRGDSDRSTFVDAMLRTMTDSPPLRVAQDQYSNITPVDYLAAATAEIAERHLGGVWHVAGREIVSRFELARRLTGLFHLPASVVEGVDYEKLRRPAPRPLRGGLVTDKAETHLSVAPPSLDESLAAWKAARPAR
jgi:dTDP-4-dehydrorhamnose reductase